MTYDIAIIMVSYNKIDAECLPSVMRAIQASSCRVGFVLVDNGSTEFSAHAFAKAQIPESVVILRDKNYGFGHSCNRGAREVDAKYYFFLNPDTVLDDPSIFDTMFAFMQEKPWTGILAPRIRHFSGELQETRRRFPKWYMPLVQRTALANTVFGRRYADEFLMRDVARDGVRLVDWVQGSAMCIPADLYAELGGFDEEFWMYFEDIDLCRRAWERHRPVYYHSGITLRHAYGKASAAPGGYVKNLFVNRALRAHLRSWARYVWKWHRMFGRAVATR